MDRYLNKFSLPVFKKCPACSTCLVFNPSEISINWNQYSGFNLCMSYWQFMILYAYKYICCEVKNRYLSCTIATLPQKSWFEHDLHLLQKPEERMYTHIVYLIDKNVNQFIYSNTYVRFCISGACLYTSMTQVNLSLLTSCDCKSFQLFPGHPKITSLNSMELS